MHPTADAAVARLAARQHGAFHNRQLRDLDIGDDVRRHRERTGAWIALGGGVHALAGHPPTWLRQAKVVELLHPDGVITGGTSAVVRGLSGFRPGGFELLLPVGASCTSSKARVRRTRLAIASEQVQGIRCATLAFTVLDVADRLADARRREVLDDATINHGLDLIDLVEVMDRHARSRPRAVRLLRPLVDERIDRSGPAESVLESALLEALRRNRVEGFEVQAAPPWYPEGSERVDVAIPCIRTIIEADGRRFHTSVDAFENDRRRDNLAAAEGWRVFRFTWRQLHQEVGRVDTQLRRLAAEVRAAR